MDGWIKLQLQQGKTRREKKKNLNESNFVYSSCELRVTDA